MYHDKNLTICAAVQVVPIILAIMKGCTV